MVKGKSICARIRIRSCDPIRQEGNEYPNGISVLVTIYALLVSFEIETALPPPSSIAFILHCISYEVTMSNQLPSTALPSQDLVVPPKELASTVSSVPIVTDGISLPIVLPREFVAPATSHESVLNLHPIQKPANRSAAHASAPSFAHTSQS